MVSVYVESNFVLELAFEQEQMDACAELLGLAQSRRIQLAVLAFALVEPLWTVPYRADKNESEVKPQLSALRDIAQHRTLGTEARRLDADLKTLLLLHEQAVETNLKQRRDDILDVAIVLPMTMATLREASRVAEVRAELHKYGCKFIGNFRHGLARIRAELAA